MALDFEVRVDRSLPDYLEPTPDQLMHRKSITSPDVLDIEALGGFFVYAIGLLCLESRFGYNNYVGVSK